MRPDLTRGGESPAGERDLQSTDPATVKSRGLTEEEQALLALPSLEDPPGRPPHPPHPPHEEAQELFAQTSLEDPPGRPPHIQNSAPPVEPLYGALDPSESFWSFGGPPEGSRRRRPVDGWGCRWYSDSEPEGS